MNSKRERVGGQSVSFSPTMPPAGLTLEQIEFAAVIGGIFAQQWLEAHRSATSGTAARGVQDVVQRGDDRGGSDVGTV